MDAIFKIFETIVYTILDLVSGIAKSFLRKKFPDFNWDSTGGTLIAIIVTLLIVSLCASIWTIFA